MGDPARRRVRRYGERGLLLELPAHEAPHAVAAALRALDLVGIDDIVPAACTVLLTTTHPDGLDSLSELLLSVEPTRLAGMVAGVVELPTMYDGPDLTDVAGSVGLRVEDVIERHSAAVYTVAFVGFAPGFAYLTGGDPALRVARRASPRSAVPSGSVALADAYCGVYPRSSPGGWQLIGRTHVNLFDPSVDPPSPLTPGTTVRFVDVTSS